MNSNAAKFAATGGKSTAPPLTPREINRSLLVLVGLPYVKCRLDLFYNQISGGSSILGANEHEERETEELQDPDTPTRRRLAIRLIRLFRLIYPYINSIYHASNLAYNIGYLFGKTRYYTPWLHLIGLEIKRMSMADYVSSLRKVLDRTLNRARISEPTMTRWMAHRPHRANVRHSSLPHPFLAKSLSS